MIEFPLVDWDLSVHYMYWSIHHWHPLVNGYSGYTPPDYYETRRLMRASPTMRRSSGCGRSTSATSSCTRRFTERPTTPR